MNTDTNEVPQWAKDAAKECYKSPFPATGASRIEHEARIIAKHAPAETITASAYLACFNNRIEAQAERDAARAELAALKDSFDKALISTEKPSIWRPVSQRPTREDANTDGHVAVLWEDGTLTVTIPACVDPTKWSTITHWTRTADLLAIAPLPREKTQAEKDADWLDQKRRQPIKSGPHYGFFEVDDLKEAIAYGRSTA